MSVTGVTVGELGRRVEDLERVTSRLLETVTRMQAVAEMTMRSRGQWVALVVAVVAAVVGNVAALAVTLVR